MAEFGAPHVDILQEAVEFSAALYRRSDSAGEIKIFQEMDVIGNDGLYDGVKGDDQSDAEAGLPNCSAMLTAALAPSE